MTKVNQKAAAAPKATKAAAATKTHKRIISSHALDVMAAKAEAPKAEAPKAAAPKAAAPKAYKASKAAQVKAAEIEAAVIECQKIIASNTKEALQGWVDMGMALIEYRAFYLSTGLGTLKSRATDENPLGSFKAFWQASSFSFLSTNDVSDAIYIAENTAFVSAAMREDCGNLNGLSCSYIKKQIKKAADAKDPKKTAAAKAKASKLAADKKKTAAAKNKTISLKEVMKDPKAFGKLIGAAMISNYNEDQINECFEVITNLIDNSAIKK